MEKEEYNEAIGRLSQRQVSRESYARGFWSPPGETDRYEVQDVMADAYDYLAQGIHNNVQAWHIGQGPLLQKVVTPTVYINGKVADTKTEYLLSSFNFGGEERQPDYVEQYIKVRNLVYEELLADAIQTDDYDSLLSVITTYRDSTLAQRLLNELYARKERYPDVIAGNAKLVLRGIDARNNRIAGVRQSSRNYALHTASQEFLSLMRRELNADETGLLKAAVLGVKIKFGRPRSRAKWAKVVLEDRLHEVAKYPSVPEQLIAREKKGLPIDGEAHHNLGQASYNINI